MRELSSNLLGEITKRLAESIQPELIYLFGSHARADADEESDIDLLAVVHDTDKSTREIAIEGRTSLWGLKAPVDLIVCTKSQLKKWREVKNNVINEAFYEGRCIYGC